LRIANKKLSQDIFRRLRDENEVKNREREGQSRQERDRGKKDQRFRVWREEEERRVYLAEEGWEVELSFHDLFEHHLSAAAIEWRQSREHFI
jgi:hypothetical protein